MRGRISAWSDGWRVVFSSRETLKRDRRSQRAPQRAVVFAPLQGLLRNVFSVLFPSDCRLCDTPLNNISRIPVCPECLAAIAPVREPQCVVCGDRLFSAQLLMGDGRCQNCRDCEPEFARAVSFGEYEGGLRGLVHLLKYESVLPVAPVLGGMLASAIGKTMVMFTHNLEGKFTLTALDLPGGTLQLKIGNKSLNEKFGGSFPRQGSIIPSEYVPATSIQAALTAVGLKQIGRAHV